MKKQKEYSLEENFGKGVVCANTNYRLTDRSKLIEDEEACSIK